MPKFYIESKDLHYIVYNNNFVVAACWALKHFLNIKCLPGKSPIININKFTIVTEFGFIENKTAKEKKERKYKERKIIINNINLLSERETDSIVFVPTTELLDMIGYKVS